MEQTEQVEQIKQMEQMEQMAHQVADKQLTADKALVQALVQAQV